MKKILFLVFCFIPFIGNGQNVAQDYEKLDIQNISLEGLKIILRELYKKDSTFLYIKREELLTQKQKDLGVTADSLMGIYYKYLDSTLQKVRNDNPAQKYLDEIRGTIEEYQIPVLTNYSYDIPTMSGVDNLLAPFYQNTFKNFIVNEVDTLLKSGNLQIKIDSLIKNRLAILHSKGIKIINKGKEKFEKEFKKARTDLAKFANDDSLNVLIEKKIIAIAFDYVKKNKEEVSKYINSVQSSIDTIKTKYKEGLQNIKSEVNSTLEGLSKGLENLVKAEEKAYQLIDEFKGIIDANKQTLIRIEEELKGFANNPTEFAKKQAEQLKILTQSNYLKDLVSDYVQKKIGFKIEDKIEEFNKIKDLFTDNNIKETIKTKLDELNNIQSLSDVFKIGNDYSNAAQYVLAQKGLIKDKKLEAFVLKTGKVFETLDKFKDFEEKFSDNLKKENYLNAANDAAQYAQATYETLVALNILKGKDAERVEKWITYTHSAIQLGTGVAKMWNGDPSGFFNAMEGIKGFSGANKKPQKSPEMKMMEHILSVMNMRFDIIEQKLDTISMKIDLLSKQVYEMHQSMANSFDYVLKRIDILDTKFDYMTKLLITTTFLEYNKCKDLLKTNPQLNAYQDYVNLQNSNNCKECIQALSNFCSSPDIFYFNSSVESVKEYFKVFDSNYKPVFELFNNVWKPNVNKYLNILLLPSFETDGINHLATYIESDFKMFDSTELNNYVNDLLVIEFVNLFDKFSYFFEIYENKEWKPSIFEDYLSLNVATRSQLYKDQTIRINNLSKVIDKAIIQQSLLSGYLLIPQIYGLLFIYNNDLEGQRLAIEALQKNALLARNFATYLLHFNVKEQDYENYINTFNKVKNGSDNINSLDKYLSSYTNDLKYKKLDNNIYITFKLGDEVIDIIIQDPQLIIKNEMIYSSSIPALLEAREKLVKKKISLGFFQNVEGKDKLTLFKYMFELGKN